MAIEAVAAAAGVAAGLRVEDGDPVLTDSETDSSSSDDECLEETDLQQDETDQTVALAALPYMNIYKREAFDKAGGHLYLPGTPVTVSIKHSENIPNQRFLSPYLYFIVLVHGSFKWTVTKTYAQFAELHKNLNLYRAKLKLSRKHREKIPKLPAFPKKPDGLLRSFVKLENRKRVLEKYLQNLLKIPVYMEHAKTLKFLEVSALSFLDGLGPKFQEGMVRKLLDMQTMNTVMACTGNVATKWKSRWLVVNDTYVTYLRPETGELGDVLLMDEDFVANIGRAQTGITHGLVITNGSRSIKVQCMSGRKCQIWHKNIERVITGTGAQFTKKNKQYQSFAPERKNTRASWFVDGAAYMAAVADAIENAKEEIFITDWKINPDIFLKADISDDANKWRLDQVIKRRAAAGVQIFILIYKELPGTVALNSKQAKETFIKLNAENGNSNISVMRHPDGLTNLKWTHHEKCVVIDQKIAFIGGLDLCEGRWDTCEHMVHFNAKRNDPHRKLTRSESVHVEDNVADAKSAIRTQERYKRAMTAPEGVVERKTIYHAGKRELEVCQEDEEETESDVDSAEENIIPIRRIYYHPSSDSEDEQDNLTVKESVVNSPEAERSAVQYREVRSYSEESTPNKSNVKNLGKNFLLRRGILQRQLAIDREASGRSSQGMRMKSESETPDHKENNNLIQAENKKDYRKTGRKAGIKASYTTDQPYTPDDGQVSFLYERLRAHPGDILSDLEAIFDSEEQRWTDMAGGEEGDRMPWHDIAAVLYGKAARDIARHFIQRWNFTRKEKEKQKSTFYPILVPKTYCKVTIPKRCLKSTNLCKCQVVRSSDKWSAGLNITESSIHNAYEALILNAKHYIYIENQFFVTCAENYDIKNRVADALYNRIIRAHKNGETFRVYVMMPLIPVVKGKAEESITPAIQVLCYLTYESICRSDKSIIGRLRKAGVTDPSTYITFYGLRKWYEYDQKLTSGLVYVHSKLLIIDDNTVLLGSANINDRSLLGSRDSELAAVFTDQQFFTSKMNGEKYQAGYFAATLRRFLFKEHLGLSRGESEMDVKDPVINSFYNDVWLKTAQQNADAYDEVFRCLPTNRVHSLQELEEYRREEKMAEINPDAARMLLRQQVRGPLVIFPLDFLKDSHNELKVPPITAKERLLPNDVWT